MWGSKEQLQFDDTLWRPATWDGSQGYARQSEDYTDEWDFSLALPMYTDPNSVHLGHEQPFEDYPAQFTVSYRIKDSLYWKLVRIPDVSEKSNLLIGFSVHIIDTFRQAVGSSNIARLTDQSELLEL